MIKKKPIILLKGPCFVVECAIRENGKCDSKTFLDSLDVAPRTKILRIIKRYADYGIIHNKTKLKKLEGRIWEFKEFQTRIYWYHCAPERIALTHGFIKKKRKIPKEQLDKAIKISEIYDEIRKGWNHEK